MTGRDITTIELSRRLKQQLKDRKLFPAESYASVISRLLGQESVELKNQRLMIHVKKRKDVNAES